jgi:hypothetical protein
MEGVPQPCKPTRVHVRYDVLGRIFGLPPDLRLRAETLLGQIRRGGAVFLRSHLRRDLYYVDLIRPVQSADETGAATRAATLSILMSEDGQRIEITGLI